MVDHHLVYLKSHLEVYCLTHASCGEKNTVSVSTNPKVAFAVPMDARTCHFHRTVGYGANGCRKIRIASRMMMMNDDDDDDDDDDADDETLRRGCCVKRRTRHVTRVHLGGAWNWTFRAERRYLDPKREHPTIAMVDHHLVHLNSHLEVYIVRHTHRAGKKTRSVLAQTPMSLFAVPMDARTCHFHRTVGYLENGCRKIRIASRMMMMRRMMMMMLMMMMVMMTRHCEGAAA